MPIGTAGPGVLPPSAVGGPGVKQRGEFTLAPPTQTGPRLMTAGPHNLYPQPGIGTGSRPIPGAGSGGGSQGGAPPASYSYGSDVQANPYLDKAFKYFEDLWGQAGDLSKETYNKEPALQDYANQRAYALKDAAAQSGARGFAPGTGMSLAQSQNYLQGTEQGTQALAGNLWNAGLKARTDLLGQMGGILGGMGGVGNNIAQNQLGLLNQGLEQQKFGLDSWYKTNMLPIEMEKAKSGLLTNQIQAMAALGGLI